MKSWIIWKLFLRTIREAFAPVHISHYPVLRESSSTTKLRVVIQRIV